MATTEELEAPYKRIWDDSSTKLLITEFKVYYELWKNGTIEKKNQMWVKIAEALNKKGLDCTSGQAENRFKTLIRSYRKACGIIPGRNGRRFHHPFTEDFTDIFIENMGLLQTNSIDDDDDDDDHDDEINQDIQDDEGIQQFLDESTGSIFTLTPQIITLPRNKSVKKEVKNMYSIMQTSEDSNDVLMEDDADDDDDDTDTKVFTSTSRKQTLSGNRSNTRLSGNLGARIDKIINSNEQILNKATSSQNNRRSKFIVPRRKPVSASSKTNVDVLLEMKELLKKIEIRRQARHEQSLKIAKERNAILKRKNELLEKLLARQD